MTRVLSGAALILLTVGVVWYAPEPVFQLFAALLVVLSVRELLVLTRASDLHVSALPVTIATLLTAYVIGVQYGYALEVPLMAALVALGLGSLGSWRGGNHALATVAAALFPSIYIGLPIGALVAVRAFGKRPLAPAISPKKTIEGAVGGFVFGTALFVAAGRWWVPGVPVYFRVVLGLAVVALGIAGDLFESMLKRSAGVKDSSSLIPGHGGVLDRIDALLFAAPMYYIFLKYV